MSTAQEELLDAIRNENVDENHIRTLMNSPDVDLDAAFHIVMDEGYSDLVQLFLEHPNVDPTMDNNFALRRATDARSDTETLALLLADGRIDPTVNDNNALKSVIVNDSIYSLKLMLSDKRVNPDTPVTDDNRQFLNDDVNVTVKLDHILDAIAGEVDNENGGIRVMPGNERLQAILDKFNKYFANYTTYALKKEKTKKNARDIDSVLVLEGKTPLHGNALTRVAMALTGIEKMPLSLRREKEKLKRKHDEPFQEGGRSKKRATRSRRHRSRLTKKNKNKRR
jgi:hypothetical protein